LPDGDRRKKRGIDFATQKHTGICPYGVRFQRIKHRIGEPGAIQRSLTLKMRFKSLAAARNWVRENPETRPATSPRAPAAATPSFPPVRPPQVSRFLVRQALSPANPRRPQRPPHSDFLDFWLLTPISRRDIEGAALAHLVIAYMLSKNPRTGIPSERGNLPVGYLAHCGTGCAMAAARSFVLTRPKRN
jgi:hypothetical protein